MTQSIKVEVAREHCYGAQNCRRAAPGAFSYDEESKAVPTGADDVPLAQLKLAEEGCPAAAITVTVTD